LINCDSKTFENGTNAALVSRKDFQNIKKILLTEGKERRNFRKENCTCQVMGPL